jgi:hypothetical protein
MCQQWLSVAGRILELLGVLIVAYQMRQVFGFSRGHYPSYVVGIALIAVGLLGQIAGGWVGRIPLDFFASCY